MKYYPRAHYSDDWDEWHEDWLDDLADTWLRKDKEIKGYCRKDIEMTKETVEKIINKNSMYTGSMGVDVCINGKHYNAPEVTFTQNYGEVPKVYIHGDLRISPMPTIKDVLFNPPATIVFWSDNTKTVVKADGDTYDPEKGIAMAISRKMIGDNKREYYNIFRHYLKKWEKQNPHTIDDYFVEGEY